MKRDRDETGTSVSKRQRVPSPSLIARRVRRELFQELQLADHYVIRQRARHAWAFCETGWCMVDASCTDEARQIRRTIVDDLMINCSSPDTITFLMTDVILMPTLIYYDRINLELSSMDPERARYRDIIGRFDLGQRATLCQYAAYKVGDETQNRGAGSLAHLKDAFPQLWPAGLKAGPMAVEFALYGLMRWDTETRANAYQITHLFVRHCGTDPSRVVPTTGERRLPVCQVALLMCVLSAYDEALSPAFFPPVVVAVASIMLALTAAGAQPWNARLASLVGRPNRCFLQTLRWCLERLYDAWQSGPDDERWDKCWWLRRQMSFKGLGCTRDDLAAMADAVLYYS